MKKFLSFVPYGACGLQLSELEDLIKAYNTFRPLRGVWVATFSKYVSTLITEERFVPYGACGLQRNKEESDY